MDNDDDDAREGRTTRNLFRTDSDSSDSDEEEEGSLPPLPQQHQDIGETSSDSTTIVRRILHVVLEERTVGGSIEHRLWPAAEYLATFVLRQQVFDDDAGTTPTSERMRDPSRRSTALRDLQSMFRRRAVLRRPLKVLELGAGVGLTGLELATQMQVEILLTDLESALPLLRSNRDRNQFAAASIVRVQKLEWGNADDINETLAWYRGTDDAPEDRPLLVLGSDCVYWESLYQPLEATIAALLQQAATGSLCLLAGMRRWKRDNHFFQHILGKSSSGETGRLECTCIDERVTRVTAMDGSDERQVMRIYAVQWVAK